MNSKTEELYKKIEESVTWLLKEDLSVYLLRKWPTELLGNPPSDYGRK
jgi:hypothetical protein